MNIIQRIIQSKSIERIKRRIGIHTGLYLKFKRFTASSSEELRTAMLCKHMGITHVIDIGANTGQFAESLYDFGFQGFVISFEPVEQAFNTLIERAKNHPKWIVAERCAIGETDGEIDIHISDDTVFSSILPIKDTYVAHNTKSKIIKKEKTKIYRLDSIIANYVDINPSHRILLKIDTQGYEKQALAGAKNILEMAIGLKIEIPLYAMYENTNFTFYDILSLTKMHDFLPYSFNIEGVDLHTGRVNTIDGLFFKKAIQ